MTHITLGPSEKGYPTRLLAARFACPLWIKGRLPPEERLAVAIVGARASSRRGAEMAAALGKALAARGAVVVSGGAIGIDGAAHRGALDGGGPTLVVLGTGIDVAYPVRHASLFSEVVRRDGALLSQFPPGTPPRRASFPVRNRIIAGLSESVVVVEAETASGSMYTAEAARRHERRVIAIAGSSGTDRLIALGAEPAEGPEEALALLFHEQAASAIAYPRVQEPVPVPAPADEEARRVLQELDDTPRDVNLLVSKTGLPVRRVATHLVNLELEGFCLRATQGHYIRLKRQGIGGL
jgi:DNA processing protein